MAWEDRFASRFGHRALMAMAKVTMDEINGLRAKAGLAPRTLEQVEAALKQAWVDVGLAHDPPHPPYPPPSS